METKTLTEPEIKADASQGIVTAYASVFGNQDSHNDRVMPGAYTKTLAENSRRVRVLRDHNPSLIVGVPQHMEQDSTGLLTVTKMSKTPLGQEMLILLSEGAYNELSVGFTTVKAADNDLGGRDLQEIKLFEYSFALWAANDLAQVTSVKHAADLEHEIKRWETIAMLDLKAGRVLSKENAQRIVGALKALQDVISAAGLDEAAKSTSPGTTAEAISAEPLTHSPLLTALHSETKRIQASARHAALLTDLRRIGASLGGN